MSTPQYTKPPGGGSTPAANLFPPPALRHPQTPLRSSPAVLLGRISRIQQEALPLRTESETAMLEAFDLARAYPGETAHLLAGIRAGLYAAGRTRPVGRKAA